MGAFIDLSGQKFGRLTVLHRLPAIKPGEHVRWLCRCECGKETVVGSTTLRQGLTRSCGCIRREQLTERATKHGHSIGGKRSRTHNSWHAMLSRCTNPTDCNWKDYGARGITVCERWLSFENFLADMGEKPAGMTLERNDNDGPYCPENCRWASRIEQAHNRRNSVFITLNGETKLAATWAVERGLKPHTVLLRLRKGYSPEAALAPPLPPELRWRERLKK